MIKTWTQISSDIHTELCDIYTQDEIQQLFLMVFEHITSAKRMHYSITQHSNLTTEQLNQVQSIIAQLKLNKPIQHIIGEAYFYENMFEVNEHTLIPRPETEELVHLIIKENRDKPHLHIIDIGTGTGCIPISLALKLPGTYTAVEVAAETIKVARRNDLKYSTNIQFIQADILEWDLIFPSEAKYDIIVSNPPYITPKEKADMHDNVIMHEPHRALFVEDDAPLLFYDYIADFALSHLTENGTLYFEINQYLSQETKDLLLKKGFADVQIIQDINQADRMIRAKRH